MPIIRDWMEDQTVDYELHSTNSRGLARVQSSRMWIIPSQIELLGKCRRWPQVELVFHEDSKGRIEMPNKESR